MPRVRPIDPRPLKPRVILRRRLVRIARKRQVLPRGAQRIERRARVVIANVGRARGLTHALGKLVVKQRHKPLEGLASVLPEHQLAGDAAQPANVRAGHQAATATGVRVQVPSTTNASVPTENVADGVVSTTVSTPSTFWSTSTRSSRSTTLARDAV